MYECEILEVEDIHHLDEIDGDGFGYKDELDLIFNLSDCDMDWK
jgi:hypothetical protein